MKIEEMHRRILTEMDLSREIEDEELMEVIHRVIEEASEEQYLPLQERISCGKELFNALRKLDILQELLEDEEITEIMINGTRNIFLEKDGQIQESDKHFVSEAKLEDVIQQIVSDCNRFVNESSPIVDARLPDGSRVNVVLKPVALNGPIVTIRKFPKEFITMDKLLEWHSISGEAAHFLEMLVCTKYNIFISGGTGSGKTTFLNALSHYIPKTERIITIEDNAELQLTGVANLVRLEAKNANVEGEGAVSIQQLIKSALRMRPDRIIVGEVRSEEAIDMLQAMNTGHDGSLSTGHANSPKDMLARLETMVLMGAAIPLPAIDRQIASAIDVIVHLGRLRDRSRRVLQITEVLDVVNGEIRLQPLYEFEEKGMKNGKILGELVKKNELSSEAKRLAAGY
ncbi:MAG: CpaF family protein [Hespellia sp.]|nr:CpaF family protein [Hespellia sp.]